MSTSPEEPALPPITVHAEAAAGARRRVSALLEAAGARPGEVQHLLAMIEAGAVEGAHAEAAQDTQAPAGSSDEFGEGWLGALQAVTSRLTHIADRTVRQARATTAAPELPPAVSSPPPRRWPTAVEAVGEEQVHRVLEAAERTFVSLTGYTGYDRDLSEEILTVVLKCVGAEQQDGYVRQLEAFAEANREGCRSFEGIWHERDLRVRDPARLRRVSYVGRTAPTRTSGCRERQTGRSAAMGSVATMDSIRTKPQVGQTLKRYAPKPEPRWW
ncbi:hypothetical protein [Streptomyces mirabilis]|uniref:hypothetical protein n=2 Tax=Streptomyces mirabilis TaxID=68239 RepID=UPI003665C638